MHVYSESKKTNAELQPTRIFLHTHTYAVLLDGQGATTCIYTKAKEKATLIGKGGRQARGPNVRGTWMTGQVHETEGSYPRPRGAMVPTVKHVPARRTPERVHRPRQEHGVGRVTLTLRLAAIAPRGRG